MLKTQYPVLHETVKRVSTRIQEKPEQCLSRFLGQMEYQLDGITEKTYVTEQRYVNTYAQWMWQRPLNYFYSLPTEEQQSIRGELQSCDLEELIVAPIVHQIERVNNKLYPVK